MIGSTGEHITRLERVNRADPLDTARNFMRHIAGIVILHQRAVVPKSHLKPVRVVYFVSGNQIWAHGTKGGARLHLVKGVAGGRPATGPTNGKNSRGENTFQRRGR